MGIRRVFLGWDAPPLRVAVGWFTDLGQARQGDFSQLLVVVPTSAAQRHLEAGLARAAKEHAWSYVPPSVMTVGHLPEQLYVPQRPFADPLLERLLWADVLRSSPLAELAEVIGRPPAASDWRAWRELGDLLLTLRKELAGDQLDCRRVCELGGQMEGFSEQARWSALARLEAEFLRRLDAYQLWDRQAARLEAIRLEECRTDGEIIMVGTVDLNRTTRSMLDMVADRVTALVFAPDSYGDRFDEHGCLVPERWEGEPIPFGKSVLCVAEDMAGAATAVTEILGELGTASGDEIQLPYSADQIAIAVVDEPSVPYLQRSLGQRGVKLRYGPGRSLSRSSAVRLWTAIAEWLGSFSYTSFAALVRHPDVQRYLTRVAGLRDDFFARLEEYHSAFLPAELRPFWIGRGSKSESEAGRIVQKAVTAVDDWLAADSLAPRSLADWAPVIRSTLSELFRDREFDTESPDDQDWIQALAYVNEQLTSWESLPSDLSGLFSASDAWSELVERAGRVFVASLRDEEAVEAEGWLDVPWTDTDVVIVVGMNEGLIPQVVNADPFLPNRLRSRLGLDDNARRFARDCYATRLLVASRRHGAFISLRQSIDGDPLLPSRLWFQQSADRQLEEIDRFVNGHGGIARRSAWLEGTAAPISDPPRPQPLTPAQRESLRVLRVTQFRDYLRCPYRFYLRHVLGLASAGGEPTELDALAFGSLLHDVLHSFAESAAAHSTDAGQIAEFLHGALAERIAARYGNRPLVSIRLQQELMAQRLMAFAEQQAELRREGWETVASECDGQPFAWECLEGRVEIVGRIDRIDWHPQQRILRVLDYKTGNRGDPPEKTHRQRDEWVDLQLPLYRHLIPDEIQQEFLAETIELGYFVLPRQASKTQVLLAEWDDDDLRSADQQAREVMEQILQEKFYPPREVTGDDEFADICLEGVLK